MRVFVQDSMTDRGYDAMAHNPGNLYFYFGVMPDCGALPLVCPFNREAIAKHYPDADYIVCGPAGWFVAKDTASGAIKPLSEPRPSKPF